MAAVALASDLRDPVNRLKERNDMEWRVTLIGVEQIVQKY